MVTMLRKMIEKADVVVPRVSFAEVKSLIKRGALIIDVREQEEIQGLGKIQGALHVSRGMLEFRLDPQSIDCLRQLDPSKPIIVYCSSGERSALAGKTLKELGYLEVYNLGAFDNWVQSGGAIESPIQPGM
jgi:rhodanese-related sulfurtransferase